MEVYQPTNSTVKVDPQNKLRLRGYVLNPDKPAGWLKRDKEAYLELLKSEALKRQDLMTQIIEKSKLAAKPLAK